MVLVNAVCSTLTAFSQGEFVVAWANTGDTRTKAVGMANSDRSKTVRWNRRSRSDTSTSRLKIWTAWRAVGRATVLARPDISETSRASYWEPRLLRLPARSRRIHSLSIYSANERENVSQGPRNIFLGACDTFMKTCVQGIVLPAFPRELERPGLARAIRRSFANRRFTRCRNAFGVSPSSSQKSSPGSPSSLI
jgi:hypothetical protein